MKIQILFYSLVILLGSSSLQAKTEANNDTDSTEMSDIQIGDFGPTPYEKHTGKNGSKIEQYKTSKALINKKIEEIRIKQEVQLTKKLQDSYEKSLKEQERDENSAPNSPDQLKARREKLEERNMVGDFENNPIRSKQETKLNEKLQDALNRTVIELDKNGVQAESKVLTEELNTMPEKKVEENLKLDAASRSIHSKQEKELSTKLKNEFGTSFNENRVDEVGDFPPNYYPLRHAPLPVIEPVVIEIKK